MNKVKIVEIFAGQFYGINIKINADKIIVVNHDADTIVTFE